MHNFLYMNLHFVNDMKTFLHIGEWFLYVSPPPADSPLLMRKPSSWTLITSFIAFVVAGTHQHNYNHVALGSPTRTPKNGKTHWNSPLLSDGDAAWTLAINLSLVLDKNTWHGPPFNSPRRKFILLLKIRLLVADWMVEVSLPIVMNIFLWVGSDPLLAFSFIKGLLQSASWMCCRAHSAAWLTKHVKVISVTSCSPWGASPWIAIPTDVMQLLVWTVLMSDPEVAD